MYKETIELLLRMQARLLAAENHVTDFIKFTERVGVRFQPPRPTGRPKAPAQRKDFDVDPSITIRHDAGGRLGRAPGDWTRHRKRPAICVKNRRYDLKLRIIAKALSNNRHLRPFGVTKMQDWRESNLAQALLTLRSPMWWRRSSHYRSRINEARLK